MSPCLKDGINRVKQREATSTPQFTGVYWDKAKSEWRARCKRTALGRHATEEAAARAYSKYLKVGAYTRPLSSST